MKYKEEILTLIGIIVFFALITNFSYMIGVKKGEGGLMSEYQRGYDDGSMYHKNCTVWDYANGRERGEKEGRQEGYQQALDATLRLVKCHRLENPDIEECFQVLLMESFGQIGNLDLINE